VLITARRAEGVPVGTAEQPRRGHPLAAVGAIGAAFLASLCCIGPLLFVSLGVGAGLASRFEPLRPIFTVLTFALLALGFYTVYHRNPAVASTRSADSLTQGDTCEASCTVERNRSRDKLVLWIAALLAIVVLTFPQWSLLFV
jgi:mercuric ion transport protein